jgi:integrase
LLRWSDVRARKRLEAVCTRAGVPYKGVHALRHYAGTRLMQQTQNLEHIARHLGHSSIETSRIYAKWSDETLREALSEW